MARGGRGARNGTNGHANGSSPPELQTEEWNAHLTERFRGKQSAVQEDGKLHRSYRSEAPGRLTKDVQAYYLAQEHQERPAKWQQVSELPTTKELLRPASVLIQSSSPPENNEWAGNENSEWPTNDNSEWPTNDNSEWPTDNKNSRWDKPEKNEWTADDKPSIASKTDANGDDDEDEVDDQDSEEPSQFRAFNKVDGAWTSKEKYLRMHYKLLRENALRNLREAIATFKNSPTMDEGASKGRICLYDDVHIKGVTFSNRGLGFKVSFSLSRIGRKIRWEQTKRLITGSLVALIPYDGSNYDVDNLKVCVVAARPLLELEKNPPQIDLFFARPEEVEIDRQKKWLMLEERSGFFEAERHTLVALQKMMHEKTPLCDHLVSLQNNVPAPDYVQRQPNRDLGQAFDDTTGPVNMLGSWPSHPQTKMDPTQRSALNRILTRRLSIVQGPPGTGKTFVSVQALKILLDNHGPDDPPIIITCQTNHALDQLLRYVALIDPACFVRLGGRSKDKEIIKPQTIYELRDKLQVKKSGNNKGGAIRDIERISKQMQATLRLVIEPSEGDTSQDTSDDVAAPINLDTLKDYGILNEAQCKSIQDVASSWSTAGKTDAEQNPLFKWAGSSIEATGTPTTAPDLFAFEENEMTAEELQEIEAEAAPIDDAQLEFLPGTYFRVRPWLSGKASTKPSRLIVQEPGGRRAFHDPNKLLLKNDDLSRVEKNSRPALLDHMVTTLKSNICNDLRDQAVQYDQAIRKKKVGMWEEDEYLIRQHKVVGLTTTGFSKYRGLVASLRPRMVLIEEAAEALEGPVIATCVESLEHLVLIGDHMQLRPHLRILELARDPYYLDTSMFERLVNNGVEFTRLERQRRMVPEVRRLLAPIYGEGVIKDHPDVLDEKAYRRAIPGMKFRTWFFDHTWAEERDDQLSTYNIYEAASVLGFVKYLMWNKFPTEQITILTFYNGQRREILRQIRRSGLAELRECEQQIKLVTVDAYQGEENGIVILSLVRSNIKQNIGFLENMNRVSVSLSRAQRGFYMFGNSTLLRRAHPTWRKVYEILKKGDSTLDKKRIGTFKFPIGPCQNHGSLTWMQEPSDWDTNMGGCDKPCGTILKCGHECAYLCHSIPHEQLRCRIACTRTLPCGHKCQLVCTDACQCPKCERPSGYPVRRKDLSPEKHASSSSTPGTGANSTPVSDRRNAIKERQANDERRREAERLARERPRDERPNLLDLPERGQGDSAAADAWKVYANGGVQQHDADLAMQAKERNAQASQPLSPTSANRLKEVPDLPKAQAESAVKPPTRVTTHSPAPAKGNNENAGPGYSLVDLTQEASDAGKQDRKKKKKEDLAKEKEELLDLLDLFGGS